MATTETVDRHHPAIRPVVVPLDDPGAADAHVTGAKAAALARASAAGLPVLAGMVVTTEAFARPEPEVEQGLRTVWSTVSDGGRRPIVARSSSTIEDNATSSMAGMFTSVLDVDSWDGFRMALDAVLASSHVVALTGPAAGSRDRAPMAVLVQPQLQPVVGGVLFGLDPVSGRRDRLVASASEAGPAAVVSGQVDGTRYVLSRRGRRVEGPAGHGPEAPLTSGQLHQLARLARRADEVFGGPQDVEWAFGPDGRLWLLQSRPITAAPSDTVPAHSPVLGPGPVAETFPDALSALEEDLWVTPLRDGLRSALALAGTAPKRRLAASPVVRTAGGRVAADLALLGVDDGPHSLARRLDPRPPARRLVAAWRVGRLRAALPALADDLVAVADRDLLDVPELSTLSDQELLALFDRARTALASLHGHEVLMGWLIATPAGSTTGANFSGASVALRALASARAGGLSDEEIVVAHPGVLALVPPRIGSPTLLPPTPDWLGTPASDEVPPERAAVLREALRLRARWVHELTAKAAEELGRRLEDKHVLPAAEQVRHLRLAELATAVLRGKAPDDLEDRGRAPAGAPLPTRFRMTTNAAVVPVGGRRRVSARAGAGTGAGGGRGMGPVHTGDGPPEVGSVLVVRTLDPALASVLPRLGGLVAETGSFLSHLAILARELGVPTVVGVDDALGRFPAGTVVVVDGTTGEVSRRDEERGAA